MVKPLNSTLMTLKITIGLSDEQHFTLNDGRTLESLNPKELMLYAVAECAGLTILDILKEHSESLTMLEISAEGQLTTPTLVA